MSKIRHFILGFLCFCLVHCSFLAAILITYFLYPVYSFLDIFNFPIIIPAALEALVVCLFYAFLYQKVSTETAFFLRIIVIIVESIFILLNIASIFIPNLDYRLSTPAINFFLLLTAIKN